MKKIILFDLDGTLTESGEGIIKSVQYALEKMKHMEEDSEKLRVFIGPPLIEQFMNYAGFNQEEAEEAVVFYRKRYAVKGIFENRPYDGIQEMLEELKEKGYILVVASSKPENYVNRILEHFQMSSFFDEVVGATMDEKRTNKADVIHEAIRRLHVDPTQEELLMVGDKEHDILGARACGIPCAAVSYGYGTMQELESADPLKILNSVKELRTYLLQ